MTSGGRSTPWRPSMASPPPASRAGRSWTPPPSTHRSAWAPTAAPAGPPPNPSPRSWKPQARRWRPSPASSPAPPPCTPAAAPTPAGASRFSVLPRPAAKASSAMAAIRSAAAGTRSAPQNSPTPTPMLWRSQATVWNPCSGTETSSSSPPTPLYAAETAWSSVPPRARSWRRNSSANPHAGSSWPA